MGVQVNETWRDDQACRVDLAVAGGVWRDPADLGDDPVAREGLAAALNAATGANRDTCIFLRGDQALPYGEVMAVMDALRAAGYLKIALVGLEGTP